MTNRRRFRQALAGEGRRRMRGDDGAVLVESAFVLPVVVLICFGIIDFGFAFRDTQTVTAATRSGARIGATLGRQVYLPDVQNAVLGSLDNNVSDTAIKYLTVYKADPSTGLPTGGGLEDCSSECARYTFDGTAWVFDGGAPWEYDAQAACGTAGHTDYLGVYLRVQHDMLTGLVGPASLDLKDSTVMRLEPVVVGTQFDDGGVTKTISSCE
jgi:hypothetical protein